MTNDADIQQQIYQYFLIEAPELLHAIEEDLYDLLDRHSVETVHNLMRNAHTLKGSAASVGRDTIKTIAHDLEDIFKSLYNPDIPFDAELSSLLLEGYECLKSPLISELAGVVYDEAVILDRSALVFSQLQQKLGHFFGQEAPIFSSTDLGYDVVKAIFQDSIAAELNQLAVVLEQGDPIAIQDMLKQQAEFFIGLAQSYNLTTWEACAQEVLEALTIEPDPEILLMIGQTALENYRQACAAILAGEKPAPPLAKSSPESDQLLQEYSVTPIENLRQEPEDAPIATISPVISAPVIGAEVSTKSEPFLALTVRVPVQQLENLNHDLAELFINYNHQSLTAEQTSKASRTSLTNFYQCRQLLVNLKDWADRRFLTPLPVNVSSNFDALEMDQYGELHILLQATMESMSRLEERLEDTDFLIQQGQQSLKKQKRLMAEAQESLTEARTVPLLSLLQRFPKMVQQLASSHHKSVEVVLTGNPGLVDKGIVEQLYDPLLHLIRNAFDHGIEPSEIRHQLGKPPTGKITIDTTHYGNRITITIKDDGQGIDWQKIHQKAIEQRLLSPGKASQEILTELLFTPGFSTVSQVSELSGRGVGLDVVRNRLQAIESSITIQSIPQQGTTFTLQIPLSLTTVRLMVCQAEGIAYAFLMDGIQQILLPLSSQIQIQADRKLYLRNDETSRQLIPIRSLSEFIHYTRPPARPNTSTLTSMQAGFYALGSTAAKPLLLLKDLATPCCLEVDQILAEQELVLKSFRSQPGLPSYILGYTVLGDGKLTLVIDAKSLVQKDRDQSSEPLALIPAAINEPLALLTNSISPIANNVTILTIDDSITQRQSLVLTLQKHGMSVIQASDGQEALEKLFQNSHINLVLCDIEMPRMDGLKFLQAYRQFSELAQVPVIMLTSRSGEKHRQAALEAGANDYMTKPYADQELLNKIAHYL